MSGRVVRRSEVHFGPGRPFDLLSEWIQAAVSSLPAFVGGLIVIVAGFIVADFIGDAMMQPRAATRTSYTSWFATGTRMFLYFTAVVIGLDTMGST